MENGFASKLVRISDGARTVEIVLTLLFGKKTSGVVRNSKGDPVSGATLVPMFRDGEILSRSQSASLTILSHGNGEFEFGSLEAGKWEICVAADGYAPMLSLPIEAGSIDNTIELRSGTALRGTVVEDQTNLPLGGVTLSAQFVGEGFPTQRALTDERGIFEFPALAIGANTIDIDTAPLVLRDGPVQVMVNGPSLSPLFLVATAGATIRGRVLDDETGAPVTGVVLRARPEGEFGHVLVSEASNKRGEFEFSGVPPSDYSITPLLARGYGRNMGKKDAVQIRVAPGQLVEGIDIRLYKGITIEGIVLQEDGEFAVGAEVRGTAANWTDQTVTDEAGAFVLAGLPDESDVTICAASLRRCSESITLHVPSNGISDVTIVLNVGRDGTIAGTLIDAKGLPVRANVTAWGPRDSHIVPGTAESGSDGRFLITGLIASTYTIESAIGTGASHSMATVTLAPGQQVQGLVLKFPEESSYTLAGAVSNEEGTPIVAKISYRRFVDNALSPAAFAQTRRDGTFSLSGLNAGRYHLEVTANGYETKTVEADAGENDVAVTLKSPRGITGTVVDATTHRPITAFEYAFVFPGQTPTSARWRKVVDPGGEFAIALLPETSNLYVRSAGFRILRVDIQGLTQDHSFAVELFPDT